MARELTRLKTDPWFDQVVIRDLADRAILRAKLCYRFKTSGLSGSEWRLSWVWQAHDCIKVKGPTNPDEREPSWRMYDGPYHDLATTFAAAYPGIRSSQPQLHALSAKYVDFMRKGLISYRANSEVGIDNILDCAGHLPWALVTANDQPLGLGPQEETWNKLCFQPGCAEPAVSVYEIKSKEPIDRMLLRVRKFCPLHLNRGDQSSDDANSTYQVLEGPGPAEAVGWQKYESRARVETIDLGKS